MVGLDVPVIPVEHQYIVTEPHPAIQERQAKGLPEMGVLREADSSWYMREEAGGLLLGPYEKGAPCCYVDGPSEDSEYELFQEDLERLEPHIEAAIARVPAFGEVGIKKIYNGAIAYTPDGSPIIGPAWGKRNFWLNEGHSFGVTAAGGAGWQLAEWIAEGEPTIDMMGVDPRRFGPYASQGYLRLKNEEAYANVFTVHYPDEERAAARPLKTAPCYGRMDELGAVFGTVYGWERPGWFAPKGYGLDEKALDKAAHAAQPQPRAGRDRRPHQGEMVVPPLQLLRHGRRGVPARQRQGRPPGHVGIRQDGGLGAEGARMARFDPRQPHPEKAGPHRALPPADARRAACAPSSRSMNGAGAVLSRVGRRLRAARPRHAPGSLPEDGSVTLTPITSRLGVLVLAGPKSRKVLEKLTTTDLSNEAFPWLSGQPISVGPCTAHALRVNFVGELGWEFHHPIEQQNALFDALMAAGKEFGIRPYGIKAMSALAIEKSYRLIPRELSIEYSAYESGLDRFVHPNKGAFIGRDALVRTASRGSPGISSTLEVHGVSDADARGSEPIYAEGKLVGRATNGGFGWRVREIPGARHGEAGARSARGRTRDRHPRQEPPRYGHRRKPLRSRQPAPARLILDRHPRRRAGTTPSPPRIAELRWTTARVQSAPGVGQVSRAARSRSTDCTRSRLRPWPNDPASTSSPSTATAPCYLGVAADHSHRMWHHRAGEFEGFARALRCRSKLVWSCSGRSG